MDKISYTSLNINPSGIAIYKTVEPPYYPDAEQPDRPKQFQDNSNHGILGSLSRKKMFRTLDYLLLLSPNKRAWCRSLKRYVRYRCPFVTLDLPSAQVHSDQVIKKRVFQPFLKLAHRRWSVNDFIWRAEKQENGNLHFHMIINVFIDQNELRNIWNRCLQNLGYVTRYRDNQLLWHRKGFTYRPELAPRWPREKQYNAYLKGMRTEWDNPNSTDIHDVKNIRNLKAYVTKYLSKNKIFSRPAGFTEKCPVCGGVMRNSESDFCCASCDFSKTHVRGRLWGRSASLMDLKGGFGVVDTQLENELDKLKSSPDIHVVYEDHYVFFCVPVTRLKALGCPHLSSIFEDYIRKKFPERYLSVIT
jgi:hypothetical protein